MHAWERRLRAAIPARFIPAAQARRQCPRQAHWPDTQASARSENARNASTWIGSWNGSRGSAGDAQIAQRIDCGGPSVPGQNSAGGAAVRKQPVWRSWRTANSPEALSGGYGGKRHPRTRGSDGSDDHARRALPTPAPQTSYALRYTGLIQPSQSLDGDLRSTRSWEVATSVPQYARSQRRTDEHLRTRPLPAARVPAGPSCAAVSAKRRR